MPIDMQTLSTPIRPDLPNHGLYVLPAVAAGILLLSLYVFGQQAPGSPFAQWSAATGTFLLLAPILFLVVVHSITCIR